MTAQLTDAEWELIRRDAPGDDYIEALDFGPLRDAVDAVLAARTADADARLAAVEGLHYEDDYGRCACDQAWWPCATIAALSATTPDAGGLLDDYDPVPGLVAHGVMTDPEDPTPDAGCGHPHIAEPCGACPACQYSTPEQP